MNLVLKKRLVGTAVLLLFSAILWPLLFQFEESEDSMSEAELSAARQEIDREIARLKEDTDQFKNQVLGTESSSTASPSNESSSDRQGDGLDAKIAEHPKLDIPSSIDDLRSGSSAADSPKDAEKDAESTLASRLDENKVPVSWVVQIATFQRWGNAEKLLNDLLEDDYRAFLRPSSKEDAGPYVLLVGPTFDRVQSENVGKEIAATFKTGQPLMRRFSSGMR